MHDITATIIEHRRNDTAFCFDPRKVLDALVEEFGDDLVVSDDDPLEARADFFRSRGATGALGVNRNDIRHRSPVLGFQFRSNPNIRGCAERYWVYVKSSEPIPEGIASRFLFVLHEMQFEGFRVVRGDGAGERSVGVDVAWKVAELFPRQGDWLEEDYLALPGNRRVELIDGRLQLQPCPTCTHQGVLGELFMAFSNALNSHGTLLLAPFPVRLRDRTFLTPDLVFKSKDRPEDERFWDGADLVVEVVSPDDPDRDLVTKRLEYAAAGIPEYWIADPRDRSLIVLTLDPGASEYREAGRYREGEVATSVLLPGLIVDVSVVFKVD